MSLEDRLEISANNTGDAYAGFESHSEPCDEGFQDSGVDRPKDGAIPTNYILMAAVQIHDGAYTQPDVGKAIQQYGASFLGCQKKTESPIRVLLIMPLGWL